jgi:hypothetical protein
VLLTIEQVADQWLKVQLGSGIKSSSLAVDLIRLAEGGAFVFRPDSGAKPDNFDPRLARVIETFGPEDEPEGLSVPIFCHPQQATCRVRTQPHPRSRAGTGVSSGSSN